MKPSQTPEFSFERQGKRVIVWVSPSPLKTAEGKVGHLAFIKECETDLEAILLQDYLNDFSWLMQKEFFTRGYDTHKKREKNWML